MEPQRQNRKSQYSWNWVGPALAVLLGGVLMYFVPNLHKPGNITKFTACIQQLKNVSIGLQTEMEEQRNTSCGLRTKMEKPGNLSKVHSVDDICHHIFPGNDGPETCRGQVVKKINEVCVPGSFKFKKIDELKYEIKAVANDKLKQNICVTETSVRPEKYEKTRQPAACIHN
jgi:hypothetical protein